MVDDDLDTSATTVAGNPRKGPGDLRRVLGGGVLAVGAVKAWLWLQNASGGAVSWTVHAMCGAVALAAAAMIALGAVPLVRRLTAREPALRDYAWNQRGITSHGASGAIGQFFVALVLVGIGAAFAAVAYVEHAAPFYIFAVIVGLLALAAIVDGVLVLAASLKYGTSTLRFLRFPYHLGENMSLELSCTRAIEADALDLTLRYVVEERRHGSDNKSRTVCVQRWAMKRRPAVGVHPRGGTKVEVTFELPNGNFPTRLARAPLMYWELVVTAETPGLDYEASFLLPVYGSAEGAAPAPR